MWKGFGRSTLYHEHAAVQVVTVVQVLAVLLVPAVGNWGQTHSGNQNKSHSGPKTTVFGLGSESGSVFGYRSILGSGGAKLHQ